MINVERTEEKVEPGVERSYNEDNLSRDHKETFDMRQAWNASSRTSRALTLEIATAGGDQQENDAPEPDSP